MLIRIATQDEGSGSARKVKTTDCQDDTRLGRRFNKEMDVTGIVGS